MPRRSWSPITGIMLLSTAGGDMDDLNGGSCPYHRITTRVAPHNAYTSSAALISCLPQKGYPTTYQGGPTRPFVDDTPAADRPASQSVTVPYHTVSVGYQFDPATDKYIRLLNGKKQIDPANNQKYSPATSSSCFRRSPTTTWMAPAFKEST